MGDLPFEQYEILSFLNLCDFNRLYNRYGYIWDEICLIMRLKRLTLENVRCYKELDVSFEGLENDSIRSRSLFLGNNGTGKSTILRSIALLLCGSSALGEILGEPNKWIRNKKKSCFIKGELITARGEERIISLELVRNDNLTKVYQEIKTVWSYLIALLSIINAIILLSVTACIEK